MIFRLETRLAPLAALVLAWACVTACKDKSTTTTADGELTVAAASDLTPAFEEIGRAFEAANKTKVVFIFGSTGMLTRQIENGAPVDLFAAANVSYIDELDKQGLIIPDSKATYARGRITLWTPDTSDIRLQGIAEPGGVCLSDDTYRQVRGKVEIAYDDLGLQTLKNIGEPMRAWRIQLGGEGA